MRAAAAVGETEMCRCPLKEAAVENLRVLKRIGGLWTRLERAPLPKLARASGDRTNGDALQEGTWCPDGEWRTRRTLHVAGAGCGPLLAAGACPTLCLPPGHWSAGRQAAGRRGERRSSAQSDCPRGGSRSQPEHREPGTVEPPPHDPGLPSESHRTTAGILFATTAPSGCPQHACSLGVIPRRFSHAQDERALVPCRPSGGHSPPERFPVRGVSRLARDMSSMSVPCLPSFCAVSSLCRCCFMLALWTLRLWRLFDKISRMGG